VPVDEKHRADGVFEGGGVKGIAFAGAIAAAERDAGVQEWVNVAGTSAGSIVAGLLVAGYDAAGIQKLLAAARYARFADTGPGGVWVGGLWNALLRLRGAAPGSYFREWMGEQLAASPLAKELGKSELTFADVKRLDLPPKEDIPGISDEKYERAKYRLHVIGSDITTGRMIILPGRPARLHGRRRPAVRQGQLPARRGGPDEHELPLPLHSGGPAPRRQTRLRRRRRAAVQLPDLAVRQPQPEAADVGVPAASGVRRRGGPAVPEGSRARSGRCRS